VPKIAILGTGIVGQTLAGGFLKHGHSVIMGTQHPQKKIDWANRAEAAEVEALSKITVTTYAEAAKAGDLAVLATKGTVAEGVITVVADHLDGKLVMDATNPIADAPPENGVLKFFTNLNDSLMERLQRIAPQARFVKCFNSVGNGLMVNPEIGGTRPSMFICGNDPASKRQVAVILEQFGWEAEDMGGAEAARAIEPLCILWCIPGLLRNEWTHAFKLLKH
jgi:8-hydroxy-5-deazaflavin:NADPH oxidoreductase